MTRTITAVANLGARRRSLSRRSTGSTTLGVEQLSHQSLSWAIAVIAAIAAAMPGILNGLHIKADLFAGGLLNPDSAMRLVRLDDIIASGQPLHAVMRDSSGAGNVMSWSHLLDSVLLLLAAPLAPLLGWHAALHAVGLATGPLSMAGLGVAVAWAAAPAAPRAWLWVGAFAVGTAPAIESYGQLGVLHHHVLLAVTAVMAAGWAFRLLRGQVPATGGQAGGAIALGAWTALGLWLSPEALPFALMAIGVLWVDWFATFAPSRPRALLAASTTFAALATLAWLVDPPSGGLAADEPDRLSLPFVLLAWGATLVAAVARTTAHRLIALVAGAAVAALWLAAFPRLLQGTSGLMSAEDAAAFFGHISEMQPVRALDDAMQSLIGGLFALAALLAFAWHRCATPAAVPLLYAAVCVAGLLALTQQHMRFGAYPAVAGAVMLPIALGTISNARAALQPLARLALLALLLGTPRLAPLAAATPNPAAAKPCPLAGAVALLADHPDEVVLAGVNETPDLLYRTPVRTVGSLYHRGHAGFMRLRAAWRGIPGARPGPELMATAATLVLGCPGGPRSPLVDDLPHQTLDDRLIAASPPAWLHRIADAGPGGYVLYAVAR